MEGERRRRTDTIALYGLMLHLEASSARRQSVHSRAPIAAAPPRQLGAADQPISWAVWLEHLALPIEDAEIWWRRALKLRLAASSAKLLERRSSRRPGEVFAANGALVVEAARARRATLPRRASLILFMPLTVVCASAAAVQEAVLPTSPRHPRTPWCSATNLLIILDGLVQESAARGASRLAEALDPMTATSVDWAVAHGLCSAAQWSATASQPAGDVAGVCRRGVLCVGRTGSAVHGCGRSIWWDLPCMAFSCFSEITARLHRTTAPPATSHSRTEVLRSVGGRGDGVRSRRRALEARAR